MDEHAGDWHQIFAQDMSYRGKPMRSALALYLFDEIGYLTRCLRRAENARQNLSRNPISQLNYLIRRLQYRSISRRLSVEIPLGVFGPGLSIAHARGIVVNGDARIGANCRIHQGVTIGAHKGAPSIGSNVFIGPNAVIVGEVSIGDYVQVGPLALVNVDVEARRTIVATRGQILRAKGTNTA